MFGYSTPQRHAAPVSPPKAVTIYYHPVIPPGYHGSTIAPHAPVIPGVWHNGQYYPPPPAYHHHAPAPTPALMPAQWDTHSQRRSLSQTQGPPYTAYNLQAYNQAHVAQNSLFVPPTQRYPVPPPGAYNTYATPHPNRVAHHNMPMSYPPPVLNPPYPGSSWTRNMLNPELIRSAPYGNPRPNIVPTQTAAIPYAHPPPGPHTQQLGYPLPPPQRAIHPVARSIAPTLYAHPLPGPHAQQPSYLMPLQGYSLPQPQRDNRPIDRGESPDSQPPHPSWLGPNGELPPRGGTPPRYRRNAPRRASTPPRQLTPSPSPSSETLHSSTPCTTPTPQQHATLIPHSAPAPTPSATPLSQLALLQQPMLSGPPQSILSDFSIPSVPGHRGIEKYEVEPAADSEDGSASEPSRGRRGRKRSRSRKGKGGGS